MNRLSWFFFGAIFACLLAAAAFGQTSIEGAGSYPQAEFHMARVIYKTFGGGGSHGFVEPWWAIDYPVAEQHFLPALRRLYVVRQLWRLFGRYRRVRSATAGV